MTAPDHTTESLIVIEAPRPHDRLRLVHIDNAESVTTSRDALRMIDVTSGTLHDPLWLTSALAEAEPTAALQRATRLLGYRERSTTEIEDRLARDGYSATVIEDVVERLVDWGYLDDQRFAEAFVRQKAAASWGRERISRALAAAGIDHSASASVLDRLLPMDAELDRAVDLARRRGAVEREGDEREIARLVRKGFSYEVARRARAIAVEKSRD